MFEKYEDHIMQSKFETLAAVVQNKFSWVIKPAFTEMRESALSQSMQTWLKLSSRLNRCGLYFMRCLPYLFYTQ